MMPRGFPELPCWGTGYSLSAKASPTEWHANCRRKTHLCNGEVATTFKWWSISNNRAPWHQELLRRCVMNYSKSPGMYSCQNAGPKSNWDFSFNFLYSWGNRAQTKQGKRHHKEVIWQTRMWNILTGNVLYMHREKSIHIFIYHIWGGGTILD